MDGGIRTQQLSRAEKKHQKGVVIQAPHAMGARRFCSAPSQIDRWTQRNGVIVPVDIKSGAAASTTAAVAHLGSMSAAVCAQDGHRQGTHVGPELGDQLLQKRQAPRGSLHA